MIRDVYNKIKIVLVEKGVTQVDLSSAIGKGRVTVNRYCNNEQQPSLIVLFEIAEYLGVNPKDLIVDIHKDT